MIDYLSGEVSAVAADHAVIDVGGIGYLASMSTKSLAALPAAGQYARVYTVLQVSDSGVALYGFADLAERTAFNKLVGVKGIGPKAALSVLSVLNPAGLAAAISAEDDRAISAAPGIGKKSAQRIILELKGTLDEGPNLFPAPGAGSSGGASALDDALAALLGMGFSEAESKLALQGFDGAPTDDAGAIRYALKRLGAAK